MKAEEGYLKVAISLWNVAVGPMAESGEDAVGSKGLIAAKLLETDHIDLLLFEVAGQLLAAVACEFMTKAVDVVVGNGQRGGIGYDDRVVVELDDSGEIAPVGKDGQQRNQRLDFPHKEENDEHQGIGQQQKGKGQAQ